ncbi:MAG: ATP-binding cassette domain-containing protein [Bdellovibrio sp.]|nr:ATP-binding cassette domain-containing protein [Bdellovibrio sp.]
MSICFDKVSKSFGGKKVLDQISFEINKGEIFFIIGKSGVGKSVTLKHIIGLLKPEQGNIFLDECCVNELNSEELTILRQKCGMVFQHPALLDFLNIKDNVCFGIRNQQLTAEELKKSACAKLALVHLNEKILNQYPHEVSFGMQKRVSIARALTLNPQYLLFDEPTTSLDPISKNAINDLILELSRSLNVTSVVVSHDIDCALKIADRILVLEDGKILALGTTTEIKNSKNPFLIEFLSETFINSWDQVS